MQETVLETPPRAWGRPLRGSGRGVRRGNTPTSVGKTGSPCWGWASPVKHPHERGEDKWPGSVEEGVTETPPRAWGRRHLGHGQAQPFGNTPTSVGKTSKAMPDGTELRKHPHERGEDDLVIG